MNRPAHSRSFTRIVSTAAVIFAVCCAAFAQEAARPDRGNTLNRNYLISDIENINLQNGNVQLSIPLATLPPIAGGKLSWTVSANYNSKLWDVLRMQMDAADLVWAPYVVDLPGAGGGWTIGGQYVMQFRNANDDFSRTWYSENSGLPQWELDLINNHQWWKIVLRMPDGAEHEFRPLDAGNDYTGTQDFLRGYFKTIPSGTAKRYHSTDGSYLFASISDSQNWTVFMPDGTKIIQTPDGIQRIKDTNGNKIKIFHDGNGSHYQDEQTGREIRISYDAPSNQYRVWFPTVGGAQQYIAISLGLTTVQGKTYPVQDWDPGAETTCQRTEGLYTQLEVVREIILPQTEPGQTRKFIFSYNSDTTENTSSTVNWTCSSGFENYNRAASIGWGELSRVIAPPGTIQTAAYTDYTYGLNSTHDLLFNTDDLARQSITEKKLNHDGIVDTWTYSISEGGTSVVSPDGNNFGEARYCTTWGVPGCSTDKAGLAYRTTRPFVMTERHWINLVFSGANVVGPGGVVSFNPVVDREYTTLLDAAGNKLKMSAKAFQYDFNGNVTQTTEYDWFDHNLVSRDAQGVPTGVPAGAPVLRVTNNSHYNQAVGSSSSNVYAKRSLPSEQPLIISAPKEITVGSSIVQHSYDGQAYGVAPTVGNLTTKKFWVDLDSKWVTTSNTYDANGNTLTSTDARGKVTQFFYEDSTQAQPTRVVVDPQNGTGTQTTTTVYDIATGLVTSQTDPNGQVSTVDYTNQLLGTVDPFARPGIKKAPAVNIGGTNHQRRVTTTYLDSSRQIITATDLNAENDKLLKTRTTTDMLGRTVFTEQTEDGTNYTLSIKNAYFEMGRVTLTSSAMRTTAASTDSWTRVTKNNGGRVIEVTTFGGATQPAWTGTTGHTGITVTAYDANFTTVTDQAGKTRRSMVDAAGRLRRVDEPNAAGSLGSTAAPVQPTSYSYDVFDNLITVTQGAQTRTFTYDSLSRLRTAVNPESGTIAYQYDDNGNLLVKTDARGVSAHFEYDAINRTTRRWYNGSNSVSATTHNSPALPAGVGATDEAKFFHDTQALPVGAPSYSRGSAVGRMVALTYGTGSNGDYFAHDGLGRPTLKIQQTGTINYQMSAVYTLSSALSSVTYPSGQTITNTYDQAGRLTGFGGNLGDGTTRTYSNNISYTPLGSLDREQFGTNTPLYHKSFFNSRGQLFDTRVSSVNDMWDWNRGRLIFYYSSSHVWGQSGTDNNGNVRFAETWIPPENATLDQTDTLIEHVYTYDSLDRVTSVAEQKMSVAGGWGNWYQQFRQQYAYDRYGNRTIDAAQTWGVGINNKQFTVNSGNNRLGVPGGQSGVMEYDAAGNLTNDTYTGAGNRTYDGENRITSAWGGNNQAQLYSYDGSGQRIKRTVNGVETWQVYGLGGELLAEYSANGPATNPQKEYGYRNGELLVTADGRTNVALAANGGVASASSAHTCCGFSVGGAINGNNRGPWGNGEGWNDATDNVLPDWFQVDFAGSKTINQIDVFSLHDNYTEQNTPPTETQTFSLYGLINFEVQYWNGSAWATIPGGSVTGNNKVWRKFTFAPITTSKIRLWITSVPDAWTRLVELQAWAAGGGTTNLAAGKPATQSSTAWDGAAQRGADGNTDGNYWNNSVTHTASETQPWWQVDLQSVVNVQDIKVWNRTDCCGEALSNFYVFVSDVPFTANDVASTQSQPGVSTYYVAGQGGVPSTIGVNRTARYVRVQLGIFERLSVAEVQVFGAGSSGQVRWLVSDQLGTPRMIFDQTGTLANIRRHDYLPFGEELFAPVGGRSVAMGYASGDGVRQQFTSKERDVETSLDYFLARYYSSIQGRFTSPDEFKGGPRELFVLGTGDSAKQALPYAQITNPQSINKYQYTYNNPLRYIDPDGHQTQDKKSLKDQLLELLGRIWRGSGNREDGMLPTSGDGEMKKDQNTFLDMNADKMVVNFLKEKGEQGEVYMDVMEMADPTPITGVSRGFLEGDPERVITALIQGTIKIRGVNIAMKEAKTLVGGWAKGNHKKVSESLDYHFSKHGFGVGASNLVQYMRKAAAFASNLRGARRVDLGGGLTRYIKNGYFVIKDQAGKILSYGKETN